MFKVVTDDPELREAACVDLYLTPVACSHMPGFRYKGIPGYCYFNNCPRFQMYLRERVYLLM